MKKKVATKKLKRTKVSTFKFLSGEHHCYILRSKLKKHRNKHYIGYTNNPSRRIRQHNGEIKNGAKRTHKYRPWEMVCIISGFVNWTEALQFEWALQNPHKSVHIKDLRKRMNCKFSKNCSLQQRVLCLNELLKSIKFSHVYAQDKNNQISQILLTLYNKTNKQLKV